VSGGSFCLINLLEVQRYYLIIIKYLIAVVDKVLAHFSSYTVFIIMRLTKQNRQIVAVIYRYDAVED
jgi:hypothetical protein